MNTPTNTVGSALPAGALRDVPYMGVIWVVAEAMKRGFWNGNPDWCNLGQGQPEIGEMDGAPPRLQSITLDPRDHAYGHINGIDELREAVAAHYNRLYRQDKTSQYGPDNVAIASGGRLSLTRVFASLGKIPVAYQTPDYTAYEDMFDAVRHRITPVELAAQESDAFRIPPDRLAAEVAKHKLGAFVLSNPCNPTGEVIADDELAAYVDIARSQGMALVSDEFYSHFRYQADGTPAAGPTSAAAHIEDIETDPVLILDGLTKNYRYPGWRVGWTVGPKEWIDTLGRAASAIDGGPSIPAQRAALEILEPSRADQETTALRKVFARKRTLMRERLGALGIRFPGDGLSTFYAWADLSALPAPFNDADAFFAAAIERKVMTVPGRFFDVNPGGVRQGPSRFRNWMRFSFGPPEDNVRLGLDRLTEMLQGA